MDTPRSKRNEKVKEEKRKNYLESAETIFQEKGFHEARVQDITNLAGTSVGNFYRYFESKEEIFEELITTFHDRMMIKFEKLKKAVTSNRLLTNAEIKDPLKEFGEYFRKKDKIAIIFLEQMGGINEKYAKMRNKYIDDIRKEIEIIIKILYEKKLIRQDQDPEITSNIWVGVILENTRYWIRTGYRIELDLMLDDIIRFLSNGML